MYFYTRDEGVFRDMREDVYLEEKAYYEHQRYSEETPEVYPEETLQRVTGCLIVEH